MKFLGDKIKPFLKIIIIFWVINSLFLVFIFVNRHYLEPYGNDILDESVLESTVIDSSLLINKARNIEKKAVGIQLIETEKISTGRSPKSILFDNSHTFIYTLNLEGMSVTEFNRTTKAVTRTLKFYPNQAKGYNYEKHFWYNSIAEKPVEGCISHDGKYLWISLHNAGGVVAWNLAGEENTDNVPGKDAAIIYADGRKEAVKLPFFETGKTPKSILKGKDSEEVYVTNWHDNSVSVLNTSSLDPQEWEKVTDVSTGAVPRGMALNQEQTRLFVSNMGSGNINVYDTKEFELEETFAVGSTPRHLITTDKYLFASLSSPEKLLKVDLKTLETIQSTSTDDDPRTITFSNDSSIIFVTCYAGQVLQAFSAADLSLLGSWESKGKPVGVDIFQEGNKLEAWVCNYTASTINIFTLEVEYEEIPFIEEVALK
ncbi:MAG: YncE family protein [Flammeovirgaceae bacterium]|nr:YncE family protein [Flammeovirgaceae bacterium]